ncbi:methyltransferase domain-containing protein [Actinoplanes sp. NPDC049596]|uniref:class I SAM-dependent methyltransferase n=1 Tax=unclassified Actinoplanes TaxID=2626549 RepID=UPI0034453EAA
MRWTTKARIQRICAAAPGGDVAYRQIQRRLGRLAPDPFRRLPQHAEMMRRLTGLGLTLDGLRCLEIGTGHLPVAPIAMYLCGAREVVTVDLHRRLQPDLTRAMLHKLVDSEDQLLRLYEGTVAPLTLRARLRVIADLADRPRELFRRIGVRYLAPGDASRMPEPDGSFDLSFSMTVLEHVTPRALRAILAESHRLLGRDGLAAHLIDPSDHFAHQDPGITRINFLRYSAREWLRIAGNEYAYCNRLRAPQLIRMFTDAGFGLERCDRVVDPASRAAVDGAFPVHPDFEAFDPVDLCTTELTVYARPKVLIATPA